MLNYILDSINYGLRFKTKPFVSPNVWNNLLGMRGDGLSNANQSNVSGFGWGELEWQNASWEEFSGF